MQRVIWIVEDTYSTVHTYEPHGKSPGWKAAVATAGKEASLLVSAHKRQESRDCH